jgi:uncharacterized protein YjiS (DUF1127 family)
MTLATYIPQTRRAAQSSGLWSRLAAAYALHGQRRALARLDAAQLDDVGLTKSDVAAELSRPLWDAPAHWKR